MKFRFAVFLACLLFSMADTFAGQRLGFSDFKIYADTANLTFKELSNLENDGKITFGEYDGLSSLVKYYWIKIDSTKLQGADYVLFSNYFERVEGYYKNDSQPYSIAGRLVEFEDRNYSKGFYRQVLSLATPVGTVYIKLISEDGSSIFNRSLSHVEVVSETELEKQSNLIYTTFTLLTGMELIILIINIFLIYLKPSKTGYTYAFLILNGILLSIFNAQVIVDQLDIPVVVMHFMEIVIAMTIVYTFGLFSAYYLNAYRYSKAIHYLVVSPYFLLIIALAFIYDGYYFPIFATLYFLVNLIAIIYMVVKAWKPDPEKARTYVLANGFSVVAALVKLLALEDILPHHFITTNAVFFGFIFRDIHFTINLILNYFKLKNDAIIHDVVIKRLEEDKLALKRIEQFKTQFFNNASHELRTPLTLILSPLEQTLKNETLPESVKRELNLSLNNGKYMLQLVNEMLDLAKLDSGKLELMRQPTDVIRVIKTIKENFASYAKERKQTIFITHAHDALIAKLDQDKFEKIMINLVSNAIKYSTKQGKIFIEIDTEGDALEVQVIDEGRGINSSELPGIFDRYYQSSEIDQTGGTGIGLSIVKEFVELHEGTVTCQSNYGSGTTFRLYFPKAIQQEKPISIDIPKDAPAIDSSLATLLLVEDHLEMRDYLKYNLDGFNVITVGNGNEALLKLSKGLEPDLILTDYMMPEMDGYELAQNLKADEKWQDIPIIFLTAKTLSADKVKVLNLGVDDYIIKPFNLDELKVRISNALDVSSKRREKLTDEVYDLPKPIQNKFKSELDLYIYDNITNPQLSNINLADYFSLSERNLYRRINEVAGRSPASYIRELRLQKARTLLETRTEMSVSEVAFACGLENLAHFSQAFKKRFGKSPSVFSEKTTPP